MCAITDYRDEFYQQRSPHFPGKTRLWESDHGFPILSVLFHEGPQPEWSLPDTGVRADDLEYLVQNRQIERFQHRGLIYYRMTEGASNYWMSPPWPRPGERGYPR